MQVDLVMWTKDGEQTLRPVLQQIDRVIPEKVVHNKFMIDDHSADDTASIGKSFGWQIVQNPSTGISAGANKALSLVETDIFYSFEQDLYLDKDWFPYVPDLLNAPDVAFASGVRFADRIPWLINLQKFAYTKYIGSDNLPAYLRSEKPSSFSLGKTFDNTAYKTKVLRKLGGFPSLSGNVGIDTVLAFRLTKLGYLWKVAHNVKSEHLRLGGLRGELRHQMWYGGCLEEVNTVLEKEGLPKAFNEKGVMFRLFSSPFSGVLVALKTKDPRAAVVHPLIRLVYASGLLRGKKKFRRERKK